MRIGLVHSFYSTAQPSGENEMVKLEVEALRNAGHEVRLVSRDTDSEQQRRLFGFRSAFRVATGMGNSPTHEVSSFRPDVIHVHNTFPNIGTQWIRSMRIPIVSTLHNYRPLCAAATLFREGRGCDECLTRGAHRALIHRCYRDSLIATVPLWMSGRGGPAKSPLLEFSTKLIALSRRSKSIYTRAGIDGERITIVANPARRSVLTQEPFPSDRRPWVFVGRLCSEKGVLPLVKAWPNGFPLDIVGDGPMLEEVRTAAHERSPSIRVVGSVPHEKLLDTLGNYAGLVFPSQWPECSPAIYPEALSVGLPVVALSGNSVADCVLEDHTGGIVNSLTAGALSEAIAGVVEEGDILRSRCQSVYLSKYSVNAWTRSLEEVFGEAVERFGEKK